MSAPVPPRQAVAPENTWNAASVYPDAAAVEAEFAALQAGLEPVRGLAGRLRAGPAALAEVLEAVWAYRERLDRLHAYCEIYYATDTTNPDAIQLAGRLHSLYGQARATAAFLEPEILALDPETVTAWLAAEPRLAVYGHYLGNLSRKRAHVRSAEVEEVLGLVSDPFNGVTSTQGMLTDADFRFPPAVASTGATLDLQQGSVDALLASPDRAARRTAWENYADVYLAHRHSLASNLVTSIKQDVFRMRSRRHASTLAQALFAHNIPEAVFHNLLSVFRAHLPTWHRYWRLRRRLLGVETLHPYDIWAPLTDQPARVTYREAVDHICAGLAPLGADYVDVMRRGCLEERWVDIYPNQGKFSGAFSWGARGTHPFIVMSYTDDIFGLSTLAHELGHSMHSYLSWQTQPKVYADYSLFAAEVASNFHQAMTRAHLLRANPDRVFQINVLEEAFANFHRYFFIMPTLARLEWEAHQRVERGQGVNADTLIDLMADLFSEAYGGEVQVDRPRVGITWAQFSHLYADYYVYQYATGISAATAFSQRILAGTPGAAEAYVGFLRAGSSGYPLDVLRRAGVDLSTPAPVEAAFAGLAGLVDQLEALTGG